MNKLDLEAKNPLQSIQTYFSLSLSTLEVHSSSTIAELPDQSEDLISPGIRHKIASTLKSVNFGKLVKPTPFQTCPVSLSTLVEPQSLTKVFSVDDKTPSRADSHECQQGSSGECNKGNGDSNQQGRKIKLRNLGKAAKKSRFYEEKQLEKQQHEEFCISLVKM